MFEIGEWHYNGVLGDGSDDGLAGPSRCVALRTCKVRPSARRKVAVMRC